MSLRPPRVGEEQVLVARSRPRVGGVAGPGEGEPRPTAGTLVGGKIIGWSISTVTETGAGHTRSTSGTTSSPPTVGAVTPLERVRLLLGLPRDQTDHQRPNLVIDVGNISPFGVARARGAHVVQSKFDEAGRLSSLRHVIDVVDLD